MSETQEYVPNIIKAEEMDPKFKYEISKLPGAEKLLDLKIDSFQMTPFGSARPVSHALITAPKV